MYDLEENNWLKFLTGKNTILIRDEVEFKLLYDFTKEVGLPTIFEKMNTFKEWKSLCKINNLDCSNGILFEFDVNKGISFYTEIEQSIDWYGDVPLTVECLRSYFDNTSPTKEGHYNKYIDKIIWNTFEQDICSNVVNYEMLDRMSEKKTLKEKETFCINYTYETVIEDRRKSGLYKKQIDKKQLKLFADYVLYYWKNNEHMQFRKVEYPNGLFEVLDLNGKNVEFCKKYNKEIYQKYINSIASINYPYYKYPKLYHVYKRGDVEHFDFSMHKLKEMNKEDYYIFNKDAWSLTKEDKEYVELKPFDIEGFLNEEFELMPNYKGKEKSLTIEENTEEIEK